MKIVIPDYIEIELVTGDLKLPWDLTIYKDLPKDEAELIERVKDAEIITANYVDIPASVIDACPNLKYIVVPSVGVEWVDLAYARSKNIAVLNCPTHNSSAVAEHAIGLFFAVQRKYLQSAKQVSDGVWDSRGLTGGELEGKEVVIIGYGNIGKRIEKKLSGFEVTCNHINSKTLSNETDELIANADVIFSCIPQNDETTNFVNAERIASMKPSATFINVGRGATVDEDALFDALKNNKIAGAGLDVFKNEPLVGDVPENIVRFAILDNVLAVGHIGYNTRETAIRLNNEMIADFESCLANNPINVIN